MENVQFGTTPGFVTTAEYRVLTEATRQPDDKQQKTVVCVEPSPDIAKAYSNALSVSGGYGGSNGATGALSYQAAEAIAQLGKRYATVQLLREMLYRDCMDYANGAIDKIEYQFRLSRFGSTVVTLLGIEMVSGDGAMSPPAVSSPTLTMANSPNSQQHLSQPSTPSSADTSDTGGQNGKGSNTGGSDSTQQQASVSPAEIVAASQAVDAAKAGTSSAQTAITALGTGTTDADKSAISDLKTTLASITKANTAIQKAWADYAKSVKPGGSSDPFTTDLTAADKAVGALPKSAPASVAKSSTAVQTAGNKVVAASADAVSAGKALDALKTASTKSAASKTAATSTNVNHGTISDQQAKTIEAMQANYLNLANISPYGIACFEALHDVKLSKEGTFESGRTELSEYCLPYENQYIGSGANHTKPPKAKAAAPTNQPSLAPSSSSPPPVERLTE
jgi:hypothetical protein